MICTTCELIVHESKIALLNTLLRSTEFSSPQPQRGMCFLPPRALDVAGNEIARAFKAVGSMIEPISFIVPRKVSFFL